MVDSAPNEHPFSPHAPCGLFFARDLSKAKKEASHCGLASFCLSVARTAATAATARAATLAVPATMASTTATARWHEHPAAGQGRQQCDNHSRLG